MRPRQRLVHVLWHNTSEGGSIALCRVPFDDRGTHRAALEAAMQHFSSQSGHPTVAHEIEFTDHPMYLANDSTVPWWSQIASSTSSQKQ